MIPPEGEAAAYQEGLNESRRDSLRYGWQHIEHLAGRSPHYKAPQSAPRRERMLQEAIRMLKHGSYAYR